MAIQWFPGHMNSTKKAIVERLPDIDAVIELLDARLPGSSSNPLLAELTAEFGDPAYARVDAAATPEQKARLGMTMQAHQHRRAQPQCRLVGPRRAHLGRRHGTAGEDRFKCFHTNVSCNGRA